MRSYKVKPLKNYIYYEFECPYCHYIIYKSEEEAKRWQFDICYCGAQIVFDLIKVDSKNPLPPEAKKESIVKKVETEKPTSIPTPVFNRPKPTGAKSISLVQTAHTKKSTDKNPQIERYVSTLKGLGVKKEVARLIIGQLISQGCDINDENAFMMKLLENIN